MYITYIKVENKFKKMLKNQTQNKNIFNTKFGSLYF